MAWQIVPCYLRLKRWNKTFKHHRGLAGAGYTCDNRQPSFRDLHLQRLDRVDSISCHRYLSINEYVKVFYLLYYLKRILARKERTYL